MNSDPRRPVDYLFDDFVQRFGAERLFLPATLENGLLALGCVKPYAPVLAAWLVSSALAPPAATDLPAALRPVLFFYIVVFVPGKMDELTRTKAIYEKKPWSPLV